MLKENNKSSIDSSCPCNQNKSKNLAINTPKKYKMIKLPNNCSVLCGIKDFEKDINTVHNVMGLQINHGGDKHRILVEGKVNCNLRLYDVMKQIEKELKIPFDKQRIFHKGVELQKFASTELECLNVFQNSMLRVTGESDNENWIENFINFH